VGGGWAGGGGGPGKTEKKPEGKECTPEGKVVSLGQKGGEKKRGFTSSLHGLVRQGKDEGAIKDIYRTGKRGDFKMRKREMERKRGLVRDERRL